MKNLLTLDDWSAAEIEAVLNLADQVKATPERYADAMQGKSLLMLFEKPSLRTRLSFEAGMHQMGGHAIFYDALVSPLGAGKETIADTARVASRFVDLIMARLFDHAVLDDMAAHAEVPVINALTDSRHPCQILADLQTIRERHQSLAGITLAYLGDAENNVTYSLLVGCAKLGMNIAVGCPADPAFAPDEGVLAMVRKFAGNTGCSVQILHDAREAAAGADVVYTDSWMSYHIAADEVEERATRLRPFQVNDEVMRCAKPDAIFMNCLPAMRGQEQTASVIDGPQSVVFDEAENRLHAQKAVMLTLLGLA